MGSGQKHPYDIWLIFECAKISIIQYCINSLTVNKHSSVVLTIRSYQRICIKWCITLEKINKHVGLKNCLLKNGWWIENKKFKWQGNHLELVSKLTN